MKNNTYSIFFKLMDVAKPMTKDEVESKRVESGGTMAVGATGDGSNNINHGNDNSTAVAADGEEYDPSASPVCKNCLTSTTPLWRRDEHGAVLCNACGLFLKLHGKPRPISLKTDVIKSRNRKGGHMGGELAHERYKQSFTNFIPTSYEAYREKKDHHLTSPTTSHLGLDRKRVLSESGSKKHIKGESKPPMERSDSEPAPKKVKKTKTTDEATRDGQKTSTIPTSSTISTGKHTSYNSTTKVRSETDDKNADKDINNIANDGSTPLSPQSHSTSTTPLPRLSTVLGDINSETKSKSNSNHNFDSPKENKHVTTKSSPVNKHAEFNSLENSLNEGQRGSILRKDSQGPVDLNVPIRDSRNSNSYSKEKSSQPQPLDTSHLSHIPPNTHSLLKGNVPSADPLGGRRISSAELSAHIKGRDIHDYPLPSSPDHNIPISVQLHNEEEVIRLRTRINELELVTDLYKRHIYELDERCKKLELELKKTKR